MKYLKIIVFILLIIQAFSSSVFSEQDISLNSEKNKKSTNELINAKFKSQKLKELAKELSFKREPKKSINVDIGIGLNSSTGDEFKLKDKKIKDNFTEQIKMNNIPIKLNSNNNILWGRDFLVGIEGSNTIFLVNNKQVRKAHIGFFSGIDIFKYKAFSLGIEGFLSNISTEFNNKNDEVLFKIKDVMGSRIKLGWQINPKQKLSVFTQRSEYCTEALNSLFYPFEYDEKKLTIITFGINYRYLINSNLAVRVLATTRNDLYSQFENANDYKIDSMFSLSLIYKFF